MAKIKPHRIPTPRIVQRDGGPSVWILGLLLIALAVWSWQVYDYGRTYAGKTFATRADSEDDLRARIAELERERDELLFTAARSERAGQIDRQATQTVQGEIRSLRRERADLERAVASLRGRLSADESMFEIVDYSLSQLESENHYSYGFTLSRMVKGHKKIEGKAVIRVSGERHGEITELSLVDLAEDGTEVHKLGFMQFQKIEGEFKLPPDFVPHVLIIDVQPDGAELKGFSQTFGWI